MLNKVRQLFLLTFFDQNGGYEEKNVNGFWLIKQFDNVKKIWQVAIYTAEAYRKRKQHNLRVSSLLHS